MLESTSPLPKQYEPYLDANGWMRHPFAIEVLDSRLPMLASSVTEHLFHKSQKFIEAEREKSWSTQIILLERPYRLRYATHLVNSGKATGTPAVEALTFAWLDAYEIGELSNASIRAFRKTGFVTDNHTLTNPTKPMKVYRGGHLSGMSWTYSVKTAKWFAERFASNHGRTLPVWKATVMPEAILAMFDQREENEVVVDPDQLIEIDLIKKPRAV